MNKKEYTLMLVMALVCWTITEAQVSAGTDHLGMETLRGLKGVHVAVEKMDPDAERDGLTTSQLQTDVELRLRKAGIRVLTQEEWLTTPGSPYLYIPVTTTLRTDVPVYSFAINIALEQEVVLKRNTATEALAATWSVGPYQGTVGKANLQEVRQNVADMVDLFINAYLAVNPK